MMKKEVSDKGKRGRANLIPANKRSKEEAKRLGIAGGIASGKVRKEKKDLKDRLKLAIDLLTKNLKKEALKAGEKDLAKDIEQMGGDVFSLLKMATTATKEEVRLKALDSIIDRTHGKAIQTIENKNDSSQRQFSTIKIIDGKKTIELK